MTDLTRVFYDTEFIEAPDRPIELISIGLVAVLPDGNIQEYYAVNGIVSISEINQRFPFLRDNVLPHLPIVAPEELSERRQNPRNNHPAYSYGTPAIDREAIEVKPLWVIRNEVREFLRSVSPNPSDRSAIELWADYAAYDHVALSQLFGRMIDLPPFCPMFTRDIQQLAADLSVSHKSLPRQKEGTAHHALNDARNAKKKWETLEEMRAMRQKQADDHEDSSRMLRALENAGVDNWQGYSIAMEAYYNPEEVED